MALQPHGPAPYTTGVSTTVAMDAWRDRGLGVPVTADILTRAGVQETIAPRTLSSMKLLGLIDADGKPTQQWEEMRLARGDDEYRSRLQEWLRGTYAEVLQYADPSTDPLDRVTEAFRTYEPAGQRKAMASLLVALWKYAGLPVAVGETSSGSPRTTRSVQRRPPTKTGKTATTRRSSDADSPAVTGLPPGLLGLLRQIPVGGMGWTKETRDNFVNAFTAVLDFTVPIRPIGLEDMVDDEEDWPEEEPDP